MAACAILLGACTSPHLVTDASGNACHLNYTEVKAQFGEHFARPCGLDLESSENILRVNQEPKAVTLMADPHSFDATHGIYTRQGIDERSQYYWMLPYSMMNTHGVTHSANILEARWHNQARDEVRLFVYDKAQKDMSSIQFEVDGAVVLNQVATWPAEQIDGNDNRQLSKQYFDVPYAVLKHMAQAHQANVVLGFSDGSAETLVLVQQGEPSNASAGLRRLFNAIETR
ncbi:hypothetical protein [Vitreoscilla stercoraria]|nr:hypothetical protein [Vitreoscilla stercoraria]